MGVVVIFDDFTEQNEDVKWLNDGEQWNSLQW